MDDNQIEAFIDRSTKIKAQLSEYLEYSKSIDEIELIQTFSKLISRIETVIHEVQIGNQTLSNLKTYDYNFVLPQISLSKPFSISVHLDQKRGSLTLPLNHYILMIPPFGPPHQFPMVLTTNTIYNYTQNFEVPNHSEKSISTIKSKSIEFRLYKYHSYEDIVKHSKVDQLCATAYFSISLLCSQSYLSGPISFQYTIDGETYEYEYDVTVHSNEIIIPPKGKDISLSIDLIPED